MVLFLLLLKSNHVWFLACCVCAGIPKVYWRHSFLFHHHKTCFWTQQAANFEQWILRILRILRINRFRSECFMMSFGCIHSCVFELSMFWWKCCWFRWKFWWFRCVGFDMKVMINSFCCVPTNFVLLFQFDTTSKGRRFQERGWCHA